MFALTITNLEIPQNHIANNLSFFRIIPNCYWIYAISNNEPLLLNFKLKLESFTPFEYLQFLRIEVINYNNLSQCDIDSNNLYQSYQLDVFYPDGIVNRGDNYLFDEFTPDKWNFWNF
jgi:hypothetical protein